MVLAGLGMATSAFGAIGSFIQAARANRERQKAEREARKAVKEARKRLEVNVYETLAVPKLPYEQATRATLEQAQMATQALQEADPRNLAGVGQIQQATADNLQQIRADKEQRMFELDSMIATEEGRLGDMGYNLSLEEAKGAQEAAKYATESRNQALQQGMAGLGQAVGIGATMPALYGGMGARQAERAQGAYGDKTGFDYTLNQMIGADRFNEYNALATEQDKLAWLSEQLTPQQRRQLGRFGNQYGAQASVMGQDYAQNAMYNAGMAGLGYLGLPTY